MNRIIIIVLLVLVAVAAWAFKQARANEGFVTMGVDDFERAIAATDSIQLLDVRSQGEYDEGHLPGAHIINVQDSSFMSQVEAELVKEKIIAVYCRSGHRSATAARQLVDKGYTVINLDGGIMAWKRAGKTVMM